MKTNAYGQTNRVTSGLTINFLKKRWRPVWLLGLLLFASGRLMATTFYVNVGGGAPIFDPDDVTIQVGDTIEWTWVDAAFSHSVTSGSNSTPDGLFNSAVHQ